MHNRSHNAGEPRAGNFNPAQLIGSSITGVDSLPYFIEVKLPTNPNGSSTFNRVRETLKRIGIESDKERNVLSQTCHILMYNGRYYIGHFKMMFIFDSKENQLSAQDIARLNAIVQLLEEWKVLEVVNKDQVDYNQRNINDIKVVKHSDVHKWQLRPKYNMMRRAVGDR